MSQVLKKFIGNDQVDDTKILLRNAQNLRARNAANSGNINLLGLNASDELAFGSITSRFASAIVLANNVSLKGRNAANSADVNVIKLNASDVAEFGANVTMGGFKLSDLFANFRNLASDPGSPVAGDVYYNTTANELRAYNGTTWVALGSGGGGANQTLSNLTSPTAINQDLIFDKVTATLKTQDETGVDSSNELFIRSGDVVNGSSGGIHLITADVTATGAGSGPIELITGASADGATNGISLATGNSGGTTDTSGAISFNTGTTVDGDSGDITFSTGTPSGTGVRGEISLDSLRTTIGSGPLRLNNAASDPGSPLAGDTYFHTSYLTVRLYDGTVWKNLSWGEPAKETFVLTGTDITNQYVTLAGAGARNQSTQLIVRGGGIQMEGASYDYELTTAGTRIEFRNDLATGGASALMAGDIIEVQYITAV